jgi:hypothetical protein
MTEENKYRALYLDFVKHQHEVNPPVRSIDAVLPDITFKTDGPTFAQGCLDLCRSIRMLADELERREAENLAALETENWLDHVDDEPQGDDDGLDRYSN